MAELKTLRDSICNPNTRFDGGMQQPTGANVPNQPVRNIPPQPKPTQPTVNVNIKPTQPVEPERPQPQMQMPINNTVQNGADVKVMNAKDSDIIQLLKSGISPTNTILLLALDNIEKIEESRNVLKIYFTKSMYSDAATKSLDLLTGIVRNHINKDYTIQIVLDTESVLQSPISQNVNNLQKVFNAKEL